MVTSVMYHLEAGRKAASDSVLTFANSILCYDLHVWGRQSCQMSPFTYAKPQENMHNQSIYSLIMAVYASKSAIACRISDKQSPLCCGGCALHCHTPRCTCTCAHKLKLHNMTSTINI